MTKQHSDKQDKALLTMTTSDSLTNRGLELAPLVQVKVWVALQRESVEGNQEIPSIEKPMEWFQWESRPLFSCKDAVLVCRQRDVLKTDHNATNTKLRAQFALLFSVHPLSSEPLDRESFAEAVRSAVRDGLSSRYRFGASAKATFEGVCESWNPGNCGPVTAFVGHTDNDDPAIVLGIAEDREVRTCHLTRRHFYPPSPLGFFYYGNRNKPVNPVVAQEQGFTISYQLLRALCFWLSSGTNLSGLQNCIMQVEQEDRRRLLTQQDIAIDHWGGLIETAYKIASPPEDLTAVVPPEPNSPEEMRRIAREFLRRPSLPQTQTI